VDESPLGYWPQGVPRPAKFNGDWKTLGWNNNGVSRPAREMRFTTR
jgi:hypothetical protein